MSLLRFLGFGEREAESSGGGETETVRRIAARLERLDPAKARFLAAFAYVLARVANADLQIDADETREMENRVGELAQLSPEETSLVVEIAKSQNRLLGGTENYRVTREFKKVASPEERLKLITCLFAVAAADGNVSATENSEINAIADEVGLSRQDVVAVRSRFRDKIGALRGMPER